MFNLRKTRGQTLAKRVVIMGMVIVFVAALALIATGVSFAINNIVVSSFLITIVVPSIGYLTWKVGMRAAQGKANKLDAPAETKV